MSAKHAHNPTAFDRLETREVLSTGHFGPFQEMLLMREAAAAKAALLQLQHPVVAPVTHTISTPTAAAKPILRGSPGNPLTNLSQDLNQLYTAFTSNGGNLSPLISGFPMFRFQGNSVSVDVRGKGSFGSLVSGLQGLGMNITSSSAAYDLVVGYVPITALPTVSAFSQTVSVSPNYKPLLGSPGGGMLL